MFIRSLTREQQRYLKKSQEYKSTRSTLIITAIVTLLAIVSYLYFGSKDNANAQLQLALAVIAIGHVLSALICLYLAFKIAKKEYKELSKATRRWGILLIGLGFLGNVWALLCGLTLIKQKRSLEYKLSYYAALISTMMLVIAGLNLFKESVSQIQVNGVMFLLVLLIVQWIGVFVVGWLSSPAHIDKRLKPLGWFYIFMSLNGNLFALLTGVVILAKIKNIEKRRSVEWLDIVKRLFRNSTAVMGLFFVSLLLAISLYSYFIFDYQLAIENNYSHILENPSLSFPFGTDEYGRDVFMRILFGARISLIVGLISTLVPIVIGGALGALSGYYGRRVDNVIMRLLDVLYAIPGILLAIAIVAAFGANTFNLIMALSIGGIPGYARMVRAQVMQLADSEFIEASRACGAQDWRIIFGDIIPNSLSPVIVRATLNIGGAVLATSALSYLGLGVQPPTPEWGNILKAGSEYLEFYPHLAIFPGLAIVAVVLSFNFFGDGLRDALDPKLK